jgi:hypothetical protein
MTGTLSGRLAALLCKWRLNRWFHSQQRFDIPQSAIFNIRPVIFRVRIPYGDWTNELMTGINSTPLLALCELIALEGF